MSLSSVQSRIESVQHDIQSLQRRLADLSRKEASRSGQIASTHRSIGRSTSLSTLESKQREIQRLQDEIARIQDDKADVSKRIADKTEQMHRYQQEFYGEQQREQKRFMDKLERREREREQEIAMQFRTAHRPVPQLTPEDAEVTQIQYDSFICHATEDKEELVRPLAEQLRANGHSIWYDEFQLKVGDSLRRSIDKGLALSRYGIVVLSPAFFAKNWPQYELDGLVAKEMNGVKVILPVWHKVSKNEVMTYSPTLADKVALNTAIYTIAELANELGEVLRST